MIHSTDCLPKQFPTRTDSLETETFDTPKIIETTWHSVKIVLFVLTIPLWPIAILMHIVAALDSEKER